MTAAAHLTPDLTHHRGSRRRAVAVAATQGTLALDLSFQPTLDPPRLRGRSAGGADVVPIDALLRRQLEAWCRRYAQAAVEIVGGDRPVSQLVRWTAPRVYDDLQRRAQLVARAGVEQTGLGRARPHVVRPVVRSAHTCFVAPGVAEVAVHVRYGERSRALAARFELARDRWVCTALEFA